MLSKQFWMKFKLLLGTIFFHSVIQAQTSSIVGIVTANNKPVAAAGIVLYNSRWGTITDTSGYFVLKNIPDGSYDFKVTSPVYNDFDKKIILRKESHIQLDIHLIPRETVLNEIVLSGVSRGTTIKENPVSITTVSSRAINLTAASNIIDVLVKNVPGLNAVKTGPNISKPFIRGLGYNRVLTLYDGIRQEGQQWGDEHGIEVDAYNIERAEVIKGPASLMFGSDAEAGVVSLFPYVNENRDKKLHGRILSEYQNNNSLVGNGLNLNYSDKHFSLSASGSYRIAKNYRNPVDGRVYNTNFREKNLALSTGYKSAKGFTHLNLTLYDNLQGIPDGSRDSLTRKFTKQIYEGDSDDIKNRPVVSDEELNSYKLSPLHQHIQHYRIYTQNNYAIGKGNMSFVVGFQQNIRREYNHPTMPLQPGMHVRLNTINYGLRYNFPKNNTLETTVGINGMAQNNKSINATDFPIPDYNLADGGIYVYARWKPEQKSGIEDKWTISGGIRYDVRHISFDNFYVNKNSNTNFAEHVAFADTANATLQFPGYKRTFTGISASIGITHELSKSVSLKANVGRGYRAPNMTEIASNGLDPGAHIIYLGNRNFNPEFSLQEDLGVIVSTRKFSGNFSAFNNNIQNYIYLSLQTDANGIPITDAQGNKTYQYEQSSAQLYGIEAWGSWQPLKDFTFNNSFSMIYGFNRGHQFKNTDNNGEYLPLIPPLKILSSASYRISSGIVNITPKVEAEINAAQNRFLALNNTETFTPGYALFNAGVATEIQYSPYHSIEIELQANNVFNKACQSNLNRLKYFEYYESSPNGHSGIYNMGRNACVKVIADF